jgi:hypothetical protein
MTQTSTETHTCTEITHTNTHEQTETHKNRHPHAHHHTGGKRNSCSTHTQPHTHTLSHTAKEVHGDRHRDRGGGAKRRYSMRTDTHMQGTRTDTDSARTSQLKEHECRRRCAHVMHLCVEAPLLLPSQRNDTLRSAVRGATRLHTGIASAKCSWNVAVRAVVSRLWR